MFQTVNAFSGFSVSDLNEAKTFYEEVLGCNVDDNGMGFVLRFSNGHNVFLYEKEGHVPAEYTTLNFPVDDIDTAVDSLVDAGVKIEFYDDQNMPQDQKGIMRGKDVGMGPDIAWFKDPAGNTLAVLEA